MLDLGILFAQLAAYAGRGFKAPLLLGMGLHNNQLCWHQDPECIYIHTFIHININVGIYSTVHAGTGPPHSLRLPSGERRIDSKKKKKKLYSTVQYICTYYKYQARVGSLLQSELHHNNAAAK